MRQPTWIERATRRRHAMEYNAHMARRGIDRRIVLDEEPNGVVLIQATRVVVGSDGEDEVLSSSVIGGA